LYFFPLQSKKVFLRSRPKYQVLTDSSRWN
jgi:hypothetical protein